MTPLLQYYISNSPVKACNGSNEEQNSKIILLPEEAIYIYNLRENKLEFAKGWQAVLGYKDDEITLLTIIESTVIEHKPFVNEINDKALHFILSQKTNLNSYSFSIEQKKLHKNGSIVPLTVKVAVYNYDEKGVISILGRVTINPLLQFTKRLRYSATGIEREIFEATLDKILFSVNKLSTKEHEIVSLMAKGFTLQEIANNQYKSKSAIEKNVQVLYKRFNVSNSKALIAYLNAERLL